MKKRLLTLIFVLTMVLVVPINIEAKMIDSVENSNRVFSYVEIGRLSDEDQKAAKEANADESSAKYDRCESLLGNPNDKDYDESVAWLLQHLLDYIKILGPVLVVVLSSLDFAKVILMSDDDSMAKAKKKLVIRLVLVAALFFIPVLVEVLLELFGVLPNPTCGLK